MKKISLLLALWFVSMWFVYTQDLVPLVRNESVMAQNRSDYGQTISETNMGFNILSILTLLTVVSALYYNKHEK